MQVTQQIIHQGPLPHPAVLEHYERILPGSAARIFAMAETQQKHQLEQTSNMVNANIVIAKRGQLFALIVALAGLSAGGVLLFFGRNLAGFSTMLGVLGSIVWTFIYGKKQQGSNPNAPPT